jgi:hypothetical protein
VFNTRRAADVARSSWWKDVETRDVVTMVEDLDRRYADYVARNPADCFLVRYEDYAKDRDSLAPLFAFLDEPFDPAAIDAARSRELKH